MRRHQPRHTPAWPRRNTVALGRRGSRSRSRSRPTYATGGSQSPRARPNRSAARRLGRGSRSESRAAAVALPSSLSPLPWPGRLRAQDSSYVLPELARPLRPLWITPASARFPYVAQDGSSFLPVICVSASRAVDAGTERRMGGFSYVQGSGDDHELWGQVRDHLMIKIRAIGDSTAGKLVWSLKNTSHLRAWPR